MNWLINFWMWLLPDEIVEELNAKSLDELDRRGLIVWSQEADDDEY
jgi:hypothetical protein